MTFVYSVGLVVFWLLGGVSAEGPITSRTSSMDCKYEDQLLFSETSDGVLFFVNQKLVDRFSFCRALKLYPRECILNGVQEKPKWIRIKNRVCIGYLSTHGIGESNSFRDRKLLLQQVLASPPVSAGFSSDSIPGTTSFSPRKVAIGLPVAFLLCCVLICPCLHAKRKEESERGIRPTELRTMNSVSSYDASTSSERIRGSPGRVPPSSRRVPPSPSRFMPSPQLSRAKSLHLNISQIVEATQNFSKSNIIGEGGFGTVYKAQLLDGQVVAVKRAKKEYFASQEIEFSNEVNMLAGIDHQNLVRLLGCIDKKNERIIITEYVPNGTLREHLDGQHGKILDFNQRLGISIDVAHALIHLHVYADKPIIHRDVKSSNVLLTENFRAKVADFGFAKVGPMDDDKTHISTNIKGTAGYLDPEYLRTSKLTHRSDVYSFGILLVEILSGRRPVEMKRPIDDRITVRWAFQKFREGSVVEILDPRFEEAVDTELAAEMLQLAFQCAAPTRRDRPTMKEAQQKLWVFRKKYENLRRGYVKHHG